MPQEKYWDVVIVTGKAESAQASILSYNGNSTVYTLDELSGKMVKRGTMDRVCSGITYSKIGFYGQGPGKVSRVLSWDRVLKIDEIKSVASTLMTCNEGRTCAFVERVACTLNIDRY